MHDDVALLAGGIVGMVRVRPSKLTAGCCPKRLKRYGRVG